MLYYLVANVTNILGYLACHSAREVIQTQNCVQFTFFFLNFLIVGFTGIFAPVVFLI